MLEAVWKIIFMVVVGAVIGGFTNYLAIKMLFHPYHPKYMGKWKLPFTPGLIPKRRQELAHQIGKLVVNHLLTRESIQRKLQDETIRKELEELVQKKLQSWLDKNITLEQILLQIQVEEPVEQIQALIDKKIDEKYGLLKDSYWNKAFYEWIPQEINEKVEDNIPRIADQILEKTRSYVSSLEGRHKIKWMIENFLRERGKMWNLLQSVISYESLADLFQSEIIKFLQSDGTKDILINILESEWKKLQSQSIEELFPKLNDEYILNNIKKLVYDVIQIEKFLTTPISTFLEPYRDKIIEKYLPLFMEKAENFIIHQSENIVKNFRVDSMIEDQIESFSLETLEELILSIAKRELMMITYLGGILGGLIGFVQGMIVLLTA